MIGTILGAALVLGMETPADAQEVLNPLPVSAPRVTPIKVNVNSMGMKTMARSAFVADVATGKVLYSKDPHRVRSIASLTKLVTAMVFLDSHPDLSQTMTVLEEDQDHETKPVFPTGETLTLEQVLRTMLVGSVNSSANMLARATGGREAFVQKMNAKAKTFRLKTPVFVDPSGLDPDNRASAADVAALLSEAVAYDKIREFSKQPSVDVQIAGTSKVYHVKSTNLLLTSYLNAKPYQIVCAKTGTLPQAGFNMAQVTSNEQGHQIVAVELGSSDTFSRFQDIKVLTTWAFKSYQWQ